LLESGELISKKILIRIDLNTANFNHDSNLEEMVPKLFKKKQLKR